MNVMRKVVPFSLVAALAVSQSASLFVSADDESAIAPHAASYGYYVDAYATNNTDTAQQSDATSANAAIGLLSGYADLWEPSWKNTPDGNDESRVKNQTVLDLNQQKVVEITSNRTAAQAVQAYLDDRRNQNYSMIDGLGGYASAFKSLTGAATTISDEVPANATTVKYDDEGDASNNNDNWDNWASETSTLGAIVKLVDTIRNTSASTSSAKYYYSSPRPWRLNSSVLLSTLVPAKSSSASTDGSFPSGHTNAAYMAAIAIAYAFPERYSEMLTRASELGYNRIVAGMHSPLDVMGARMMSTAIAAAALNSTDNTALKTQAYNDAQTYLATQTADSNDRFSDYATNRKNYIERLTYGFTQTGDTTKAMRVPKGAEVLLETRLPYLDATQRRWVLYTTGLASGYPLLDDEEGWGRLDLFSASNGYGAFVNDVTVDMDASKGGYSASDSWKNDISGSGKLTKKGTGKLALTGANSYTGGTVVSGGTLEADSTTALGTGSVLNQSKVILNTSGTVKMGGDYTQSAGGTLEMNLDGSDDSLQISGAATYSGTLKLYFNDGYVPADGTTIISAGSQTSGSTFSNVVVDGLPSSYTVSLSYENGDVKLHVSTNGTSAASTISSISSSASTANPATGSTATNALPAGAVLVVVTAAGALAIFRKKTGKNG